MGAYFWPLLKARFCQLFSIAMLNFLYHCTVKHFLDTNTDKKVTLIGNLAQHYVAFFRGLYILGLTKHAHETTFKTQLKYTTVRTTCKSRALRLWSSSAAPKLSYIGKTQLSALVEYIGTYVKYFFYIFLTLERLRPFCRGTTEFM